MSIMRPIKKFIEWVLHLLDLTIPLLTALIKR